MEGEPEQTKENQVPPEDEGMKEKAAKANHGNEKEMDALILALAAEKMRSEEYLNRLKYLQADFDNYRKRADRNTEEAKRTSVERIINNLLEVVDELELAVKNGRSSNDSHTVVEGVEMTLKKLRKVLESEGVTSIDSLGKPFNPAFHAVVCASTDDDVKEGTIIEELRKGYVMNDKVIRPSMVKISTSSNSEKKCNNNNDVNESKQEEKK